MPAAHRSWRMPTGGTSYPADGVDGALEPTPARFARRMKARCWRSPLQRAALLRGSPADSPAALRARCGGAQVEALYESLAH